MENKSLIKTIIVCITLLCSCSIISYSIYESNRYEVVASNGSMGIIDKYTKTVHAYIPEKKEFVQMNNK